MKEKVMNDKPKTVTKLTTAVAIGEIAITGMALALKVLGLFRSRGNA